MSWYDGLFRRSSGTHAGPVAFPHHVELVPGVLRATVSLHEIDTQTGTALCWSYVTDGLTSQGQKELIFTLRCERDEPAQNFPRDPLDLFVTINELAQQGQTVDVGGVTRFGANNFLGRHLAYIDSQPFPGVTVPPQTLAAILVTEDEAQAVQEFGILRVMSRLGFASRYFPCPPWSDRSRVGISFAETRRDSILSRVLVGRARGVRVVREGQLTTIRVDPQALRRLQKPLADIAAGTPIALLTDFEPRANGCLVWEPGQSAPGAITPPHSEGSCLCGSFAIFVPQQLDNEVRLVEDGFGLMVTDDAWTQLRQALTLPGNRISLPCKDGGQIVLEQLAV